MHVPVSVEKPDKFSAFSSIEPLMQKAKRRLNTQLETKTDVSIVFDGREVATGAGVPLLESINRALSLRRFPRSAITQLGPIETCNCCMIEIEPDKHRRPSKPK